MSESRTNMRRGHGPMRGMGATEKAKDFKGTIGKLLAYIGKNSLIIYGLHALIFSTFVYTFISTFFKERFGTGIMLMVVQIIYTLVISIGICKIIDLIKKKFRRKIEE